MENNQLLEVLKKDSENLFMVDSGVEIYYVYAKTQEAAMAKAKALGAKEIKVCEYIDMEARR